MDFTRTFRDTIKLGIVVLAFGMGGLFGLEKYWRLRLKTSLFERIILGVLLLSFLGTATYGVYGMYSGFKRRRSTDS